MTDDEQRIAIAEACGWTQPGNKCGWIRKDGVTLLIPHSPMHEKRILLENYREMGGWR